MSSTHLEAYKNAMTAYQSQNEIVRKPAEQFIELQIKTNASDFFAGDTHTHTHTQNKRK